MTMKFENTANIGDTIKAYDFVPRSDVPEYYLMGRILSKGRISKFGFDGYTVEIVGQGEHNRYTMGETAYVPYEMGVDFENRVQLMEAA